MARCGAIEKSLAVYPAEIKPPNSRNLLGSSRNYQELRIKVNTICLVDVDKVGLLPLLNSFDQREWARSLNFMGTPFEGLMVLINIHLFICL